MQLLTPMVNDTSSPPATNQQEAWWFKNVVDGGNGSIFFNSTNIVNADAPFSAHLNIGLACMFRMLTLQLKQGKVMKWIMCDLSSDSKLIMGNRTGGGDTLGLLTIGPYTKQHRWFGLHMIVLWTIKLRTKGPRIIILLVNGLRIIGVADNGDTDNGYCWQWGCWQWNWRWWCPQQCCCKQQQPQIVWPHMM